MTENKKPIRSTEGNRNKLRRIDKQVVGIFTKKNQYARPHCLSYTLIPIIKGWCTTIRIF